MLGMRPTVLSAVGFMLLSPTTFSTSPYGRQSGGAGALGRHRQPLPSGQSPACHLPEPCVPHADSKGYVRRRVRQSHEEGGRVEKPVADFEMVLNLLSGTNPLYSTGEISEAGMTFSKAVYRLAL